MCMGIFKNKKTLIIGIAGFLGALAITIGVLLLKSTDDDNYAPDLTANGVMDPEICRMLGVNKVQAVVKDKVDPVYGPNLIGLATLPSNDTIHVCVYPFINGASAENNYHIDNGLSFEVYAHVSDETKQAFASVNDSQTDTQEVSELGDRAVYTPVKYSDGSIRYELVVYSRLVHYTFRISQPEGVTTFDAESAKTLLVELAKNVSF